MRCANCGHPLRLRQPSLNQARSLSATKHDLSLPKLQCLLNFLRIAKGQHAACHLLISLMPLACHQHHVLWRGVGHGVGNGQCSVGFHQHIGVPLQAQQHLTQNEFRRLTSRVVAGQHNAVGLLRGHCTHERPLGCIASAPATHHTPKPSAAGLRQRTQTLQDFGQGVRRVGVVDHT